MLDQGPDAIFKAQPPSSRLLITLVIDTSSSMGEHGGIGQLNDALPRLKQALTTSSDVALAGEIALITFGEGGVRVRDPRGGNNIEPASPFVPIREFDPPTLTAAGVTPMTEAISRGLRVIQARKAELKSENVSMKNRPLMYLVTDGAPTDERGYRTEDWTSLVPVIEQQVEGKHLLLFAFGVENADRSVLERLAPQSTHMLASVDFATVIELVSASIDYVSSSAVEGESADAMYRGVNQRIGKIQEFLRRG